MSLSALVTDTHPLLFYMHKEKRRLSKSARSAFDRAVEGEQTIYVPAYVLIEVSQLQKRGRIKLSKPVSEWALDLFASSSFVLAPLDAAIIARYDEMTFTEDPADALIVATAVQLGLPLITNDSRIHAAEPCLLYWD